jgi:hypothetical protein
MRKQFSFTRFLMRMDRFGPPVMLNFKGEETHQTIAGACLSLVFYVFMFIYAW